MRASRPAKRPSVAAVAARSMVTSWSRRCCPWLPGRLSRPPRSSVLDTPDAVRPFLRGAARIGRVQGEPVLDRIGRDPHVDRGGRERCADAAAAGSEFAAGRQRRASVGYDKLRNQWTSTYTVITDAAGKVMTAFPGPSRALNHARDHSLGSGSDGPGAARGSASLLLRGDRGPCGPGQRLPAVHRPLRRRHLELSADGAPDSIQELAQARKTAKTRETVKILNAVERLARRCETERLYLRFTGD
jgi:hypothetical protein